MDPGHSFQLLPHGLGTRLAASEHPFSALRRVKTYLRSAMSQDRLIHLMILYLHKEPTDALEVKEVSMISFVDQNTDYTYLVDFVHECILCPSYILLFKDL